MATVKSPFNEISTFILSPAVVYPLVVFLYRPVAKLPDFIDHGEPPDILPYEMCVLSAIGTISIYTMTEEFYDSALNYLTAIYGYSPIDEGECVCWDA